MSSDSYIVEISPGLMALIRQVKQELDHDMAIKKHPSKITIGTIYEVLEELRCRAERKQEK